MPSELLHSLQLVTSAQIIELDFTPSFGRRIDQTPIESACGDIRAFVPNPVIFRHLHCPILVHEARVSRAFDNQKKGLVQSSVVYARPNRSHGDGARTIYRASPAA
jgi:hypothetical protein